MIVKIISQPLSIHLLNGDKRAVEEVSAILNLKVSCSRKEKGRVGNPAFAVYME